MTHEEIGHVRSIFHDPPRFIEEKVRMLLVSDSLIALVLSKDEDGRKGTPEKGIVTFVNKLIRQQDGRAVNGDSVI